MMGFQESPMVGPVPQLRVLLIVMSTVSCTSSPPGTDSADADGHSHADHDSSDSEGLVGEDNSDDAGPDPSQAPRVLSGDIWCYEHSTGDRREPPILRETPLYRSCTKVSQLGRATVSWPPTL